jgi:protein gp37
MISTDSLLLWTAILSHSIPHSRQPIPAALQMINCNPLIGSYVTTIGIEDLA